jgi:hypothetical protein
MAGLVTTAKLSARPRESGTELDSSIAPAPTGPLNGAAPWRLTLDDPRADPQR